jgi:Gas vesicle synthesis protein GvpL/GvpF
VSGEDDRAGWYVYGVTDSGADLDAALTGARPIDPGARPFVLDEGPVAAIVSNVSLAEFDEAVLPDRLNDPGWLFARAAAHEDVLEHALAMTTVIPFRFGTVYTDEASVRSFLSERGPDLEETLARLRGRVELGVKAFVDRDRLAERLRAEDPDVARLEADVASAPEGRAYMLRRQADRRIDDVARRFEGECAAAAHEALSSTAEDARLNAPQAPELSGRAETMILNGAYLVRSQDSLDAVVETLTERYGGSGVTFEVTGPWPPYNFVAADER